MKVKKVLFYAAPVALAGFLYLGEATGIGEVLAKTVKTVIQTETVGDWEQVIIYQKTDGEFTTENFIYKLSNADPSGSYVYHKYPIIKTDIVTETEVPDDSQSSDVSVKVVPTVDPEAEAAYQRELQEAIEKARERGRGKGTEGSRAEDGRLCERDCEDDRTGNPDFCKGR